jgi:uncharacterized protein (DUF1330 family)
VSAYVIFFVKSVHDPEPLETYKRLVKPTLEKYGAVVRALKGRFEVLEGDPLLGIAMIEFASMADARAWYDSVEYQSVLKYRLAASSTQTVLFEGVP